LLLFKVIMAPVLTPRTRQRKTFVSRPESA